MKTQPLVSLLHTSARPTKWREAYHSWVSMCSDPRLIEYVLTSDEPMDHEDANVVYAVNRGTKSSTTGWNLAAELSTGKILITIADDYFPTVRDWDQRVKEAFPSVDGKYVLQVDNGDNAFPLMAFCFMTRPYYEQYGFVFYPEYIGMMADWDYTSLAYKDRVVIDARHLKFRHLNPEEGTTEWDEVYHWQRRQVAQKQGQEIYDQRKKAGVFLTAEGEPVVL